MNCEVWQNNILPKRSLLESLDDSNDDHDISLPLLCSSVQATISQKGPATNTDFHLPPLTGSPPQSGCTVAAEAHVSSRSAAWRQQSSAATSAQAAHSWGLAAEFAASGNSTLLPGSSSGMISHSVSNKQSIKAGHLGNSMSQDGPQDPLWTGVLRGSEDSSCGGGAAAPVQVSV